MKILESAPRRYDKGIWLISFGNISNVYDRLTSYIQKGQEVLDIGCGTGALTLRAAKKGAHIKGIDINPQMLDIAQKRIAEANLSSQTELIEMGIAELDQEKIDYYDVVMSSLCFSELNENEQYFALKHIFTILKPDGLLLIADEVKPHNFFKKLLHTLLKLPLAIITYMFTQSTTKAVHDLPQKISASGFNIITIRKNKLESFIEVVAQKQMHSHEDT